MTQSSRTALVTGGTGFIGSHVVDALLDAGWRVRCTVRATSNLRWMEGKDAELVVADLRDSAGLKRAVDGIDALFHCAGLTRGSRDELFAANEGGTRTLLDACSRNSRRVRFVYCSSQAAAGPGTLTRPRDEDDPPAPTSDYGRSKLAGEEETRKYAERLEVAILRPVAVYGPRDEDTLPYFQMAVKGLVVVPGIRRRLVQLVHARDVAAALLLAADDDRAVGRTYFVGHPEILDWRRLASEIAKAVGRNAMRLRLPSSVMRMAGLGAQMVGSGKPGQLDRRRAADMLERAWTCRVTRLISELSWEPVYDAEAGLKQTAEWYREEGWI
jgi:nucleoside-diphosphate-sugar epimerase